MDHLPVADEGAAGDLRSGEAEVDALADRRADERPVERRDGPADHPPERARVRVVVGVRRRHPGGDRALVVEMRRHGGLDEARPACRQGRRVVEELERDEPAADADGEPGRPVGTREGAGEGTGVLLLGRPELVERRRRGAQTGPGLAAADLRPDLALVGGEGMRRGRAGGGELVDAAALLARPGS